MIEEHNPHSQRVKEISGSYNFIDRFDNTVDQILLGHLTDRLDNTVDQILVGHLTDRLNNIVDRILVGLRGGRRRREDTRLSALFLHDITSKGSDVTQMIDEDLIPLLC